jgi:alkanesulfonate monooxygenase SsuD/methylene tetrahydromethanopterin reductase-like flavin-dependent oxidoreductase (luciferase family)
MNTNNNKLTFGIFILPVPPWTQIVEQARLVESLGFDKIWLPDHFVMPRDKDMPWFDCWAVLAALATQTDRITLGTLVSSMTLRNPAVLARTALTVDHVSGGRVELGVGAAGAPHCHAMTGVPRWPPRERSERFHEYVAILDSMLTNEETTYRGSYYDIEGALMRPGSLSQPRPVLNVAARGPKAIRLAGRLGDAWNSYYTGDGLTPEQSSEIMRQRCESMCEAAVAAGRDPAQIGRTFLFGYTPDRLFRSMESFYDGLGRYAEAGINDFGFIYVDLPGLDSLPRIGNLKEQAITTEDLLRRIALEAIPTVKDKIRR